MWDTFFEEDFQRHRLKKYFPNRVFTEGSSISSRALINLALQADTVHEFWLEQVLERVNTAPDWGGWGGSPQLHPLSTGISSLWADPAVKN